MAKDPPNYEPRSFVASATVVWKKSLTDYPASLWTLKYTLRGADATGIDVTATADGDDHLVTISSTNSDKTAGVYRLVGWVEQGTLKYYVVDQQIVIRAKPAAGTLDTRTDAEIILARLVDLVKTKSLMLQQEYTIAGRTMQFSSYEDLIKATHFWSGVVRDERRQKKVNEGGDFFDNVHVRF